jgi:hypothetical protein
VFGRRPAIEIHRCMLPSLRRLGLSGVCGRPISVSQVQNYMKNIQARSTNKPAPLEAWRHSHHSPFDWQLLSDSHPSSASWTRTLPSRHILPQAQPKAKIKLTRQRTSCATQSPTSLSLLSSPYRHALGSPSFPGSFSNLKPSM